MRVRGDRIFPPAIGGRLSILFSILRQFALVISTGIATSELRTLEPDIIVVDQLSACIPLIRLLAPRARVLFYGHYPDRLLAAEGNGALKYVKRAYRIPFDVIEGWSTGCADGIAVNSKFTRSVFRATFSGMRSRDLKVIYPCVDTENSKLNISEPRLWPDKKIFLSINRFEGKKNLALAIRAYAGLSAEERSRAKLVMAGGWDPRAPENAVTHRELQVLTESLNLTHATFRSNDTLSTDLTTDDVDALFLLSIPNDLKLRLLHTASLLIYTPKDEHFGIVPLEAMLAGVPVLATNTGGPLETIYDGRTGWLRNPDKVELWTDVMRKPLIPSNADTLRAMGQRGRERVMAEFSHTKMTESLDKEVQQMCQSTAPRPNLLPDWLAALFIVTIIAVVGGMIGLKVTLWASNMELSRESHNVTQNGTLHSGSVVVNVTATASRDEL